MIISWAKNTGCLKRSVDSGSIFAVCTGDVATQAHKVVEMQKNKKCHIYKGRFTDERFPLFDLSHFLGWRYPQR
jgi:hypothetical protein